MDLEIREGSYELSPAAATYRDEHNAAVESARRKRDRFNAEAQRLATIKPENLTAGDAKAKRKHLDSELEILQAELALTRSLLSDWAPLRQRERHSALVRAREAHTAAVAAVVAKLEALGFDAAKFAAEADGTPEERYQIEQAAQAALDALSVYHPSVAPALNQLTRVGNLSEWDLLPRNLSAEIEKMERRLREVAGEMGFAAHEPAAGRVEQPGHAAA